MRRHAYLFFLDFEDASGRTPCKPPADASNVAKADAVVMLPVKNFDAIQLVAGSWIASLRSQ
jgi:hypothetical protein